MIVESIYSAALFVFLIFNFGEHPAPSILYLLPCSHRFLGAAIVKWFTRRKERKQVPTVKQMYVSDCKCFQGLTLFVITSSSTRHHTDSDFGPHEK